jgi:hypothetical protein
VEMDNLLRQALQEGNGSIDMSLTPAYIYAIQLFLCVDVR